MSVPLVRVAVAIAALVAVAACKDGSGPGDPDGRLSLNVGQVAGPINGNTVIAPGGDNGADYTIVAQNGSESFSTNISVTFSGTGVGAVPAARTMLPPALLSGGSFRRQTAGLSRSLAKPFEASLRRVERQTLRNRFRDARAWQLSKRSRQANGVSFNTIPSSLTIGQQIAVNVSLGGCTATRDERTGRVVAITSKAIILADVANPAGGFTDAEYQSIGATFDTLVAPVDEAAFGAPADMDQNGKIVLFFSRAVNELTPRGQSDDGIVGGFFFARDLFPKLNTTQFEGCASSNEGELFYLLVADPNGEVSDARTKAYVTQQTIATVAHEYQHLINASRRLFVNTQAEDFEEIWLNEGLSHIAEELLFYHVANLAPRQNVGVAQLQTQARFDAFLEYMIFNLDRYRLFLEAKAESSPWANNDDLETRGAAWSLLRYLADHRGTGDGDTWNRLVNSTTQGIPNLTNVFGASLPAQVSDWATSNQTDDLTGFTEPQWQQRSWNARQIMGALRFTDGSSYPTPYPLEGLGISATTPATATIAGGGFEVIRFSVPANSEATITWTAGASAPPETFRVMVTRVR